jgi:2-polyprenyl-6-hydroxyphenyl methylase/3-demethylubiquinone-9 3-methyltransferase
MPPRLTPCICYDGEAEAAATFYAATFPDSHVGRITRAPGDYPAGVQGAVLTVEFTVCGVAFLALNAGSGFPPTDTVSFQIHTDDQAETDRLWHAIVDHGGSEQACSWCKDRWGVAWQIVPRQLTAALLHPDPAAAARAFQAMMAMRKIDIAAIEAAVRGDAA